jgi:hypothetical protein
MTISNRQSLKAAEGAGPSAPMAITADLYSSSLPTSHLSFAALMNPFGNKNLECTHWISKEQPQAPFSNTPNTLL